MIGYSRALVTLLGLGLALGACNEKKGNRFADAPPPAPVQPFNGGGGGPTAFDQTGFEAFRRASRGPDVREEFFAKYSGRFHEHQPKVRGQMVIGAGRLRLDVGGDGLCGIHVESNVERVTVGDSGYVVWFRTDKTNRECLRERIEATDIQSSDGRIGLAFDYYNANTLRLAVRGSYIFFLR